jgi:hypothetical protein
MEKELEEAENKLETTIKTYLPTTKTSSANFKNNP